MTITPGEAYWPKRARLAATHAVIWAFFLLIFSKLAEFLTITEVWSLRPAHFYFPLAVAAIVVALADIKERGACDPYERITKVEIAFFVLLGLMCVWSLIRSGEYPYGIRIAVWQGANLLMAFGLFYSCRVMGLRDSIRLAAGAALVLQLAAMAADLWFPGTFAEWYVRPAGLPRNPNTAAAMITILLALTLPSHVKDPARLSAIYLWLIAAPLVFLSASRSGWILFSIISLVFVAVICMRRNQLRLEWRLAHLPALTAFVALLTATALFSPTVRAPETTSLLAGRTSMPSVTVPLSDLNAPKATASKSERDIIDVLKHPPELVGDQTASLRAWAAMVFWRASLDRPLFGWGTGFSMNFPVGPHNGYLALSADSGLPGLVLYVAVLGTLTWLAVKRQSPVLVGLAATGFAYSCFSHNIYVDPQLLVAMGVGIGLSADLLPADSRD